MAIGRISGPMLLRDLERQGIDLSVDGNLIYFDVTQRRIGINTSTPNVELDLVGSANITNRLYVGEKVTVGNLTVGPIYSLPTEQPEAGQILVARGGPVSETYWSGGVPVPSFRRRRYTRTISSLLGYGTVEIILELGVASVIYGVSLSRPAKIEAFSTPAKDEDNPYTFIATPDHLVDDGTVILNDGSSFQSRQYSLWINLEEPPKQNIYVTITSLDSYLAGDPITLDLFYFPAVTDSGAHVDVVDDLPLVGYLGKMVYLTTDSKVYFYGPGGWVLMNTV